MKPLIIEAITKKLVLSFTYDGIARAVEPHAIGISLAGNEILRCYQIRGDHINPDHDWNLCEVRKMVGVKTTGEVFQSARSDYKRGDRHMTQIYAQL
jgi:hypothetical protein